MTFYDMIMRMKGVNMFDSFPLLKTDLLPYKSLPSQVILVSTIGEQIGNNAPPPPPSPRLTRTVVLKNRPYHAACMEGVTFYL